MCQRKNKNYSDGEAASSGQMSFQSLGRRSLRVTCPSVAFSIEMASCGDGLRNPEHKWLSLAELTPSFTASSFLELFLR